MDGGGKTWSERAGACVQFSPETWVANLRNVRPIQESKNQITKWRSRTYNEENRLGPSPQFAQTHHDVQPK